MEICDGIKNLKVKSTETIKPEIRIGVLGNVDSGKSSTMRNY